MPIVEITGPAVFSQDVKDRLAKKITEVIAEEEKKAIKRDTTGITIVSVSYTHLTLPTNREV